MSGGWQTDSMAEGWTITLSRDEALVLADYLHRWSETGDQKFVDDAERQVLDNLLCPLESADDCTAFNSTYGEQVEAARKRLRPET